MKKFLFFVCIIFIIKVFIESQAQMTNIEVLKISAYEASERLKSGKAILIYTGTDYHDRHMLGAMSIPWEWVKHGKFSVPNLPRDGREIFIYCY